MHRRFSLWQHLHPALCRASLHAWQLCYIEEWPLVLGRKSLVAVQCVASRFQYGPNNLFFHNFIFRKCIAKKYLIKSLHWLHLCLSSLTIICASHLWMTFMHKKAIHHFHHGWDFHSWMKLFSSMDEIISTFVDWWKFYQPWISLSSFIFSFHYYQCRQKMARIF